MNKIILVLVIIVGLNSTDVNAKKKLYKWVDENGNVSYSDQVPPERIKKEHQELNDHGVVVENVGNARSKEEYLAEKEAKRKKIEAEKIVAEQDRIRLNIIKSYTNEGEIVRLKDERIEALERNILLAGQSLKFQQTSREQLLSMAADNERNGMEISKALKSRITIIEEKIKYQQKFIEVKKAEIEKVNTKFKKDLEIYREAQNHLSGKSKARKSSNKMTN